MAHEPKRLTPAQPQAQEPVMRPNDPANLKSLPLEQKLERIQEYKSHCNGTSGWTHTTLTRRVLSSDGVHLLAQLFGAYWLLDTIESHQPKLQKIERLRSLQTWSLWVDKPKPGLAFHCAKLRCEDGDGREIQTSVIEYCDMPVEVASEAAPLKLWLIDGRYLQLPEEY